METPSPVINTKDRTARVKSEGHVGQSLFMLADFDPCITIN